MPRASTCAICCQLLPCLVPGSPAVARETRHAGMVVVRRRGFTLRLETYVAGRGEAAADGAGCAQSILKT